MHLTIRADGGPSIGYGHLVRTGALAEQALDKGDNVTYVTCTPAATRTVCPESVEIVELDSKDTKNDFLTWLSENHSDVVLTDSYQITTDYQRAIQETVPIFVVVVDDARVKICANVLVNGNIYAPNLGYQWIGSEPKWCLGTDYVLLREEIREVASQEPPFRANPENALITMGASDIRDATPNVVRAFDGTDVDVDVVVGPGFENRDAIDRAVVETDGEFNIVQNPTDLPERMYGSDLAVSATGSTIYELLTLGTPTIGLPQADNQKPIADALANRNAIVTPDGESENALATTINSLLRNSDKRKSLRDVGIGLFDGRGVERVYDTILGVVCS